MAVEVEGSSQLEEFLGILKRKAWWIAVPTIVFGTIGIAFAVIVPKKFVATAQVLVRDTVSMTQQSPSSKVGTSEGRIAPPLIKSRARIRAVLGELPWSDYRGMSDPEQEEFISDIVKSLNIDLQAIPDSAGAQIVNLSYSHTESTRAYEFLRELIRNWKTGIQVSVQESLHAKRDSHQDTENAEESKRVEINRRINEIQTEYNIGDFGQDSRGGNAEFRNPKALQLEALNERIAADEQVLAELDLEIEAQQARYDVMTDTVPRTDAVVVEAKTAERIEVLQMRLLALLADRDKLLAGAPTHKRLSREIDDISAQIAELRGISSDGRPRLEEDVPNEKKGELRRKLEQLRADRAKLEKQRLAALDEREQLEQEARNYFAALAELRQLQQRFMEVSGVIQQATKDLASVNAEIARVEGDAGQFFEDLEFPRVPNKPTKPSPMLISVMAVLLGLALGLGIAVISEFSRSTFRSARDLSRVMVVPVLGTVNRIVTRRQRSRSTFLRAVLGISTAVFVCVIGYVTWAWANERESLSVPVLELIEGLRKPFL